VSAKPWAAIDQASPAIRKQASRVGGGDRMDVLF
jgi:hypothetical protein